MKRLLFLSIAGAFLLALPGAPLVWGKAHVPIDMVQVCNDKDEVKNIKPKKLAKELAKGGCRLPACVFGPTMGSGQVIFFPGNACTSVDAVGHPVTGGPDGFCDTPGPPSTFPACVLDSPFETTPCNGVGLTSACTNPF